MQDKYLIIKSDTGDELRITKEVTVDIPLTDEECLDIIGNGMSMNIKVIITDSRRILMFATSSLENTIELLSSVNLVDSIVKLREIREWDISTLEDPNKYETLFEPEI